MGVRFSSLASSLASRDGCSPPWRQQVPARSVHIQNKDVFWPHAYRWRLSAAPRHDGTEEDMGREIRRNPFYYYYPWRTLSDCDARRCPIAFLGMWDLPPADSTRGLSLSADGVRRYKGGEWKWASCYRRGRSPDHSLSDHSLISADFILGEVRGRPGAAQTLIR